MPSKKEYIIHGPPVATYSSPSTLPKSLSTKRESRIASNNLRELYRDSALLDEDGHLDPSSSIHATTTLPPTPPRGSSESAETKLDESSGDTQVFRSTLVTPINQQSPPTPDNTPPRERDLPLPRPFLGAQTSFTSTRADSFKTAKEDILTDDDSDVFNKAPDYQLRREIIPSIPLNGVHRMQPLPVNHLYTPDSAENVTTPDRIFPPMAHPMNPATESSEKVFNQRGLSNNIIPMPDTVSADHPGVRLAKRSVNGNDSTSSPKEIRTNHNSSQIPSTSQLRNVAKVRRGPSLRDRLAETQQHSASPSTEKFASIIGWNISVNDDLSPQEDRRLSSYSTSSTVDAYVLVQSEPIKRKMTLRHRAKNASLRSVSSPLPNSNRTSLNSSSDSPHRLVHKKAKLNNQNRWSFGSEASRSLSMSSGPIQSKPEVIRVAVIPERSSSLNRSTSSPRSGSNSIQSGRNHSRKGSENPPSSWQHNRTLSESTERGRDRQRLVIPPRSSSLSAPTSRSTSRAASITSEHLRVRRQEAETDLRKTLDRMESDRLAATLQELNVESNVTSMNHHHHPSLEVTYAPEPDTIPVQPQTPAKGKIQAYSTLSPDSHNLHGISPGSAEWAAMRPSSFLATPFSQPSFQSASPEIIEARAVNFFPHNNHSLQLIEPNPLQESQAVREVRKHKIDPTESPLRHPRSPPEPPRKATFPPTPTLALPMNNKDGTTSVPMTLQRTSSGYRNINSLTNSLTRHFSLKNARNRRADEELDGKSRPFWRPHAFWDEDDRGELENGIQNRAISRPSVISNSLGLPQERTVINGPLSLVRHLSERRRQQKSLMNKSSHGSLARIRASRQLQKGSGLGFQLRFIGLHDIQDRLLYAKHRKEEERREARRAALRESIGPNIVSRGDSRFPASNASLVRS